MIGDADPADGYDASDPDPVRLAVLARVVDALEAGDPHRGESRRLDALRVVAAFLRRRHPPPEAETLRARLEAL